MMKTLSARKLNEWAAYFQVKNEQTKATQRQSEDAAKNEKRIRDRGR